MLVVLKAFNGIVLCDVHRLSEKNRIMIGHFPHSIMMDELYCVDL